MIRHSNISDTDLHSKIRRKEVVYAGNKKLKIYGHLHCLSGKRMRKENRVFFFSVCEAKKSGYRPCGHCMREEYKKWKDGLI